MGLVLPGSRALDALAEVDYPEGSSADRESSSQQVKVGQVGFA